MGDSRAEAQQAERRRRPGILARLIGQWAPLLLATLIGLVAIGVIEHTRRHGIAEQHDAEARRCGDKAAAFYNQGQRHLAADEKEEAAQCFASAGYWSSRSVGYERMEKEYRKPFWEAWLSP